LPVNDPHRTSVRALDTPLSRRSFIGRGAATLAATGTGGALLAACGSDDSSSKSKAAGATSALTEVSFVQVLPPSIGNFAELLADVRGYFRDEHIKVKNEISRGSATAVQSLIAGKSLMTATGIMGNVLNISNQGAPLILVSNAQKVSALAFVSSKKAPMNAPEDFRGKTVGIPSKGGSSELSLNVLLEKGGIPLTSVKRQVVGITPGTYELVRKGRIAGFVVSGQDESRFKAAIPDVNWLPESKYIADGYGYWATDKGLKANRETIQAYLRAVTRATKDVIADKGSGYSETLKDLRAHYDFDGLEPDSVAKPALDYLISSRLADGAEELMLAKDSDVQNVYDELLQLNAVKKGQDPTAWVDTTLMT
jgi:NitT/TauT family transport system substrate-binding protein